MAFRIWLWLKRGARPCPGVVAGFREQEHEADTTWRKAEGWNTEHDLASTFSLEVRPPAMSIGRGHWCFVSVAALLNVHAAAPSKHFAHDSRALCGEKRWAKACV